MSTAKKPSGEWLRFRSATNCRRGRAILVACLCVAGASCSDAANGPRPPAGLPAGVDAPANAHGENAELLAAGQINGCSAAAIDVGGDDLAPAYVLSAGHCAGGLYWQPNQIFMGVPGENFGSFGVNGFWDTENSLILYPIAALEYSTMHLRDVSIFRLQATVGELRSRGVEPFPIATEMPPLGAPITAVGHPGGGELRRSQCTQGKPTRIAEDEFLSSTIANDCPGIMPGSSGSPVRNEAGEVFGVVSTVPEGGKQCTMNNPCDVEATVQPASRATVVYAAPVSGLSACFTSGVFTLSEPGCILPTSPMPNPQRGIARYTQPSADGLAPRWNVSVPTTQLAYYRFKTGAAATTRCDDDSGYGEVLSVATNPVITAQIAGETGVQVLCVHGGTRRDLSTFTPLQSAAALLTQVDDT